MSLCLFFPNTPISTVACPFSIPCKRISTQTILQLSQRLVIVGSAKSIPSSDNGSVVLWKGRERVHEPHNIKSFLKNLGWRICIRNLCRYTMTTVCQRSNIAWDARNARASRRLYKERTFETASLCETISCLCSSYCCVDHRAMSWVTWSVTPLQIVKWPASRYMRPKLCELILPLVVWIAN